MIRSVVAGILLSWLLVACTSTGGQYQDNSESKTNPAEVNAQLGIEYMRKGMYEAAQEKLKKSIRQNPDLQLAHVSLGILYERLGEETLAAEQYRKAYSLDDKDPVTLNAYGQYLCRTGKLDEADKMFRAAVKDPLYQYPEMVYTNAGICARRGSDNEMAEKYFREALKHNPKYTPALQEMARISFGNEQYLATRAYLQRLQALTPLTPEFLWIGARAEHAMHNRDGMSSYALVLKNRYPEAEETQALIDWERKLGER